MADSQELSSFPPELPEPDEIFDSGDRGCGELLGELVGVVRRLPDGAVLGLINTDPGTPEDLPAWCRMVGHTYLGVRSAARPMYLVQKRSAPNHDQ